MFGQAFNSGFLSAPCFTDTTDIFKDRSGVALYTLDYDASDSGGATGKYKEGAVFNGNSSQIDTTATLIPNSTDFSISFWIKPENQFGSILARGLVTSGANAWGFDVSFNNSANKLRLFRHTGGAYANEHYAETASNSITVGVWQHVVLSFDKSAGAPQFYIDGSAATTNIVTYAGGTGSAMATGNIAFNSSYDGGRYRLGNRSNGGLSTSRLKGTLDHFRVFNKVVSASEVATLYSDATDTIQVLGDTSCTAFYNFNNNALDLAGSHNPNSVSDIIYKYDGTPTAVDFGVGGKSNYGARFNGSSSKIELPNSSLGITDASNFSISYWFNTNSTTQDSQSVIWANGSNAGARFGSGINSASQGGDTSVYFGLPINGSFTYINSGTSAFTANTWVHVVCVKSSTTGMSLYVDNVLKATNTGATGSGSATATGKNSIGMYHTTSDSGFFNGDIDQVRIFNRALDSTEVSKLYGNGAGEIACKYKATTTDVNYPATNVAYYKLDNSAVDETGNYDGTTANVSYEFGRFGQAAHFSSGTFLTSSFASLSQVTVSFWVKMTDVDTTRAFFISRYGSTREFAVYNYDNQFVASIYYNGNNGNATILTTSDYFNDNTWHHIAYTANGSTAPKLYIDGVETGSSQYTDSTRCAYYTSSEPLSMGYSRTSSAYNSWDGRLDQVRIFSSVLDSTQITKLYNEKPEVDTSTFKTVLYEGNDPNNNTVAQLINNVGFRPDLVWIKNRENTNNHVLLDSVRGDNSILHSNTTDSAAASYGGTLAIEDTGFTTGKGDETNKGLAGYNDFVAWCWKAGGDAVSNTNGSITSQVSANTAAGFSIVKYTGNLSAATTATGQSVGHGLSSPPELIIFKRTSATSDWWIMSSELTNWSTRLMFDTSTTLDYYSQYPMADPTSNVFYTNYITAINVNASDYIAYCFHSVSGVSDFGTYTGTGASGNSITTGFEPSFLMVKGTTIGGNWLIFDNKRPNNSLFANLTNADSPVTTNNNFSFNSNGFTSLGAGSSANNNGDTYLYIAFK